jgi:hypothetical protein
MLVVFFDVSVNFTDKEDKKNYGCLKLANVTDRLFRNVGEQLPTDAA